EGVFSEQVVELWNHGVVVGNDPGFELPQSALDLCGREFHCTLPSIGSLKARFARPPTADGRTLKLGHPAALRKVSLHTVKGAMGKSAHLSNLGGPCDWCCRNGRV